MLIPVNTLPPPMPGRFGRAVQEIEWLLQDISWETLEDLPTVEAAAQITLWAVRWRRLDATVPKVLRRRSRDVLDLLMEACARYPGRLPRISVLDAQAGIDLDREVAVARDLLAGAEARRARGGWKDDLLQAAHELGIDQGRSRPGDSAPGLTMPDAA